MIVAVLSDVHSNIQALTATILDARGLGAEHFVCLGDIVGYNCFPHETIQLLQAVGTECVQGNHDRMVLDLLPVRGGPNACQAVEWTRKMLCAEDRQFLLRLPLYRHWENDILLLHSTLNDTETRSRSDQDFCDLQGEILQRFPAVRLVFTGHSHIGCVTEIVSGKVVRHARHSGILSHYSFYFVNPGSVSNPRCEDYRCSYVLYDTATKRVRFRKVAYDTKVTCDEDRRNGISADLGPSIFMHRCDTTMKRARSLWHKIGPARLGRSSLPAPKNTRAWQ